MQHQAEAATPPNTDTPSFTSISRIPLLPDALLKEHRSFCAVDTRFRAAARLLQSLWLKNQGIAAAESADQVLRQNPTSTQPSTASAFPTSVFGSTLHADAARAGLNFLDPEIHLFVREQLLMREEGAAYDEDRLFGNALSSMPLCFNLFAPLALNLQLATTVFRQLLPDFVHEVLHITFEHSPGRREERFLLDGTAFDLAIHVTTTTGEPGVIFIELKYSEAMEGPAARHRPRYDDVSALCGLFIDPQSRNLRSTALEQLWREHMLAQTIVDEGITPRAIFMAIGPQLNRRVQAAFRLFANELIADNPPDANRVTFIPVTLESVINAIAYAGAAELAQALWSRYCGFFLVYALAMKDVIALAPGSIHSTDPERALLAAPTTNRSRRPLKSGTARAGKVKASSRSSRSSSTATPPAPFVKGDAR